MRTTIFSQKGKLLIVIIFYAMSNTATYSQQIDTTGYHATKKNLEAIQVQIKALQEKQKKYESTISTMDKSIRKYPIWNKGIQGTVGFNISRFRDWLTKNQSNTIANTISYSFNGFINLEEKKYYWNNRVNLVQSWQKFEDKDASMSSDGFKVASDAFLFNSLLGFKFSKNLAVSASSEYSTGLLDERFNNPSTFDFGAGASWKPTDHLVISTHPITYNAVISDMNIASSLGFKTTINYMVDILKGFNWTSNFSGFLSYKDENLSNWLWSNSIIKKFKYFGIGFDAALKQNRQEAVARGYTNNPLQWYYILGLSYKY